MTILHLLSQNQLTGAEVYAVGLIQEQIKNHTVYQISNGFFIKSMATQIQLNVETKSIFEFIQSVFKLRQFLIEHKIQVIHAHSRAASKLAHKARLGLNIAYISTLHGRQHSSISKKLFNIYGDFQIAVCQNIKNQLKSELRYNSRRIKTIENGIDLSDFKFQVKNKKTETLKIGIIGRDTGPKKHRTEIFIKAVTEHFDKLNLSFSITVIGGHKNNYSVTHRCVTFLNSTDVNSELYHQFDLICGSGRVCIEALISGVPVIAFGESRYCGLVNTENYDSFKQSNFGDIGSSFDLPKLNTDQLRQDISQIFDVNLNKLSELAISDFNLTLVALRVQRVYESSYFLRHYSKWIPILMYHKIPDQDLKSQHKIFVTKNNFEKHLRFFNFCGFTTMTFSELADYRCGRREFSGFPKKPLILTFDDGYLDNLKNADPLLKKYNIKAQIFLLANANIESNTWDQWTDVKSDQKNFSPEKHDIVHGLDRKNWSLTEFEIGSHGLNHQKMPLMNKQEKLFELMTSKVELEKEFSVKINSFAYTYGDTNSDCSQACELAGYDYGLNTDRGGLLLEEDPYAIFRVNIFPQESFFSLLKKTWSGYRMYYYFKRKN